MPYSKQLAPQNVQSMRLGLGSFAQGSYYIISSKGKISCQFGRVILKKKKSVLTKDYFLVTLFLSTIATVFIFLLHTHTLEILVQRATLGLCFSPLSHLVLRHLGFHGKYPSVFLESVVFRQQTVEHSLARLCLPCFHSAALCMSFYISYISPTCYIKPHGLKVWSPEQYN